MNSRDIVKSTLSKYWLDILVQRKDEIENNQITIDHLIADSCKTPTRREAIVGALSEILWEGEKNDLREFSDILASKNESWPDNWWVEKFTDAFLNLLISFEGASDRIEKTINILKHTSFVSLNYERCFAFHFYKSIHEYITLADFDSYTFLRDNETILRNFFTVHQPHGSFGTLGLERYNGNPIVNIRSDHGIRLGSYKTDIMSPSYGSQQPQSTIHLVGEQDLQLNYAVINNEVISTDSTCVVLGCSANGISGTEINWDLFSQIYFCSKEDEFPIHHPNVVRLEMYGEDLVKDLAISL